MHTDLSHNIAQEENSPYMLYDTVYGDMRSEPLFCVIRYIPHVAYEKQIVERTCFDSEYEEYEELLHLQYPQIEILQAYTVVDWRYEA